MLRQRAFGTVLNEHHTGPVDSHDINAVEEIVTYNSAPLLHGLCMPAQLIDVSTAERIGGCLVQCFLLQRVLRGNSE